MSALAFRLTFVLLLVVSLALSCRSPDPTDVELSDSSSMAEVFDRSDLENLGHPDRILFWTPEQQVAGYRNIDRIFDTRTIRSVEGAAFPLESSPRDLSRVSYELDGETYTLEDYVTTRRVAGLLVVKDGAILYERYELGNDQNTRWVSFSIAKSVVSMLVGAAIRDGYIESVEDPVTNYLPLLKGGAYDEASIKDILQMASGARWNEDYDDPDSDVGRGGLWSGIPALIATMKALETEAPPGARFNYNTGETNLVGALVRGAIGNNLSTYLEHKIWQPFGMESDATWMLHEPAGGEWGGCCISATLRDYARIGLFALAEGQLPDGRKVLPDDWMTESTTPSSGYDGYGYLWWLRGRGVYSGIGIFGQLLWIDPADRIIIVTHSAWPNAGNDELRAHRWAFVEALSEAVRD